MGKASILKGVVGSTIKAANNGNISAIDKATELAGLNTTVVSEAKRLKEQMDKNKKSIQEVQRLHGTLNRLIDEHTNADIKCIRAKQAYRGEVMNVTTFELAVKGANPAIASPFTKNAIHKLDSKLLSDLNLPQTTIYAMLPTINNYNQFKSQQLTLINSIKRTEKEYKESIDLTKKKKDEIDSVNKSIEKARGD